MDGIAIQIVLQTIWTNGDREWVTFSSDVRVDSLKEIAAVFLEERPLRTAPSLLRPLLT